MRKLFRIFLLLLIFCSHEQAWADPSDVLRLELGANTAVAPGSFEPKFNLQYYVVPKDWIKVDGVANIPPELLGLIKEDAGHYRWFFHPADKVAQSKIRELLIQNHLDAKVHALAQQAERTGSRSSFLEHLGSSDHSYSLRMSVDKAPGNFTGEETIRHESGVEYTRYTKHFQGSEASWTSEIARMNEGAPMSGYAVLQPDVLGVQFVGPNNGKASSGQLAYSFRDISQFNHAGNTYVPDFSTYHPQYSELVASINGRRDSGVFWAETVGKNRGQAAADLLFHNRLIMASAHSQNYLEELDAEMRPTGREVIRDLGDTIIPEGLHPSYPNQAELSRLQNSDFKQHIGLTDVFKGSVIGPNDLPVGAAWSHGGGEKYVSTAEQNVFQDSFRDGFVNRLSQLSGVSTQELMQTINPYFSSQNGYFYMQVKTGSTAPDAGVVWHRVEQAMREHPERVNTIQAIDAPNPDVLAALSDIKKGDMPALEALAHRNPDIVRKAGLISLAQGGNIEFLRPVLPILEQSWHQMPAAAQARALLTQQLVLLGSRDADVLITHAISDSRDASRISAVERMSGQVLTADQLRTLSGALNWRGNAQIRSSLFAIFENAKTTDPVILTRLLDASGASADNDVQLMAIFKNVRPLPQEVAEYMKQKILKRVATGNPLSWSAQDEILASDPEQRSFFEQFSSRSKDSQFSRFINRYNSFIDGDGKRTNNCGILSALAKLIQRP